MKKYFFEGMTKTEHEAINGRYSLIDNESTQKNNIKLIGVIGSLYVHDMTDAQIDYIKKFYKVEKQKHYIISIVPDDIVLSPVEQSKHYNGFIVFEV